MFKKVCWKWFHGGRFMFLCFMRREKRNLKEKTNKKRILHMRETIRKNAICVV